MINTAAKHYSANNSYSLSIFYFWPVKAFLHILGIAWKTLFVLGFVLSLVVLYPFFWLFLSRERWYGYCFKLMRAWAKYLIYGHGLRYELIKEHELPPPPYIICPNHTSYLDIVLTYCVFPDYFVFMGKQELSRAPLFNVFFKKMNILVDRKSVTGSHRAFLRASEDVDKGHCIAIFPEGTISKQAPSLLPFKNGPFKLAVDKQIPIVPVTYMNNWNLLQDGAFFKARSRPGKAMAIIHKPIYTKGKTAADLLSLKNEVYKIIEGPLTVGKY